MLSRHRRVGKLGGAWCVRRNDHNQYLQVDLRRPTRITKVTTQGRYDANQFVRTYRLLYSQNGNTFIPIKEGGKIKVCYLRSLLNRHIWYHRFCLANATTGTCAVFSRQSSSRLTFLEVVCLQTSLGDLKMIRVFTRKIKWGKNTCQYINLKNMAGD